MKAALINNFPPYSGTGRVAYELFQAFKEFNSLEADLFCTHYLQSADLNLPANDGVKFLQNFPYKDNENLSRLLIYFVDPFRLPRGYDLYHVTNHMLGNYLYWLKPAVITVHDLLQFKYEENRGDNLSSKIYNTLLRVSLNAIPKAKRIICVSEWTRQEVIKRFNLPAERVVTVYNGINHGVFNPGDKWQARKALGLSADSKIILHVGAETKRKNIPVLLRALKILLAENENILLVRVGEKKPETAELINQLGLKDKVHHFENVAESALVNYYRAADVFVLPSLDEGFGFPVLEALACGLPVVSSDRGPLPEIGDEAVTYFNPLDINQIAMQLRLSLNMNETEIRQRQELGLAQAKKFTWEKNARETFEVYRLVLKTDPF